MLILSRKRDEVINIGNDVVIKVIRTGRNSVKIGIEAPSYVHIARGELTPDEAHGEELLHDEVEHLLLQN